VAPSRFIPRLIFIPAVIDYSLLVLKHVHLQPSGGLLKNAEPSNGNK